MRSESDDRIAIDVSPRGVGARIYYARRAAGLSAAELAERVEKNPSYVSRIENGRVLPSLELLYDIADKLHVSVIDLLTDEEADAELEEIRPEMVEIFTHAKLTRLLSPGLKRELIEVYRRVKEALDAADQSDQNVDV